MPTVLTLVTRERLLPAPPEPDVRVALAGRLVRLAGVDAAHLARLRQVREVVDGFVLVHEEPPDATVLATAPPDGSTPQALALGLALVQALAALHAVGLAHGAVAADVVLVGADGSVTLTAAGTGWSTEPVPVADDVAGLARLLLDRLDPDSIGSPLALLLVRAADPDPLLRPRLAALGEELERAARPEPPRRVQREAAPNRLAVAVGGAAEQLPASASRSAAPVTRRHARSGRAAGARLRLPRVALSAPADVPWRGIVLLVVWCVGVVLLVQGAVGLWRTRTVSTAASIAPGGSPTAPAASVDWSGVVTRLDADRRAAIRSGSTAALAEVVDPQGPAYAHDVATLRARTLAGLELSGGAARVTRIRVVDAQVSRVVLDVTDTRGAWQLTGGDGVVVASGQARGPARWRVVLSRTGDHWRFDDVSAA